MKTIEQECAEIAVQSIKNVTAEWLRAVGKLLKVENLEKKEGFDQCLLKIERGEINICSQPIGTAMENLTKAHQTKEDTIEAEYVKQVILIQRSRIEHNKKIELYKACAAFGLITVGAGVLFLSFTGLRQKSPGYELIGMGIGTIICNASTICIERSKFTQFAKESIEKYKARSLQ